MGAITRVIRRIRRRDLAAKSDLTREYWEDAADGTFERAADAICTGYSYEQFKSGRRVHFDESELGPDMVVLDLCCGMGRTCGRVAPLVKEYHGVDFAEGMIAKAREHNMGVSNAAFHVNDGRTLGGFADGTFDVVYSELAFQHMPRDVQGSYAAEAARVLVAGGRFFAQLPRIEFYPGTEYALAEDEARALLSPFASAALGRSEAYWLARAVAGGTAQCASGGPASRHMAGDAGSQAPVGRPSACGH